MDLTDEYASGRLNCSRLVSDLSMMYPGIFLFRREGEAGGDGNDEKIRFVRAHENLKKFFILVLILDELTATINYQLGMNLRYPMMIFLIKKSVHCLMVLMKIKLEGKEAAQMEKFVLFLDKTKVK